MDARDEERVRDREILPFSLASTLASEILRRVTALNEDLRSLWADDVKPFVRAGLNAAEIALHPAASARGARASYASGS